MYKIKSKICSFHDITVILLKLALKHHTNQSTDNKNVSLFDKIVKENVSRSILIMSALWCLKLK